MDLLTPVHVAINGQIEACRTKSNLISSIPVLKAIEQALREERLAPPPTTLRMLVERAAVVERLTRLADDIRDALDPSHSIDTRTSYHRVLMQYAEEVNGGGVNPTFTG